MHAALKLDQHGKIVLAAKPRGDGRHVAELEPHHVEHVNGRFEKEASGDLFVAGPDRLQQFAAIHLDMRAVRRSGLEQFLNATVDGCEAAIEADLEDGLFCLGCFEKLARCIERGGHGLLAKHMLARLRSRDHVSATKRARGGDAMDVAISVSLGRYRRHCCVDVLDFGGMRRIGGVSRKVVAGDYLVSSLVCRARLGGIGGAIGFF